MEDKFMFLVLSTALLIAMVQQDTKRDMREEMNERLERVQARPDTVYVVVEPDSVVKPDVVARPDSVAARAVDERPPTILKDFYKEKK